MKALLLRVADILIQSKGVFFFPDLRVTLSCRNKDGFGDLPPNFWLHPSMFGFEGPEEPHNRAVLLTVPRLGPGLYSKRHCPANDLHAVTKDTPLLGLRNL